MKRMFRVIALAVAFVSPAMAQGTQGASVGDAVFSGRLDLQASIAGLSALARSADSQALAGIPRDMALLLFGTLSKPMTESEEPFWSVAEFMEGSWVGTSKIELHRVFIHFRGERFRDFLEGASGMRAVIIARNASIREERDGTRAIHLDAVSVRPVF